MTEYELFQSEFLHKLGYDVARFEGDKVLKYAYLKDDRFCFLGKRAEKINRSLTNIRGSILVKKDDDGFHFCPSHSEDGEPILYQMGNTYTTHYYILWEDDEYTELSYLNESECCSSNDTFEYFKRESFFAVKFHKEKRGMLDAVVSREKDIYHLGVYARFINNRIIVYDEFDDDYAEGAIVYDEGMNIIYKRKGVFDFFEKDLKYNLVFPRDRVVYNLSDDDEFKLQGNDIRLWNSIKSFGDFFILYNERRNIVEKSSYYDYTEGCIYDINFIPIREFNVLGKIESITPFGDTKMLVIDDSNEYNGYTDKMFFNVYGYNETHYDEDINKKLSFPELDIFSMDGYENLFLMIVRAKTFTPDTICFLNNSDLIIYKCGVYQFSNVKACYEKIIDCKYDYIKPLPLWNDNNIYYLGIVGKGTDKKCDLYVNHKLFFNNYPFDKEHNTKVVGKDCFIQFTNMEGKVGFIRDGKIVFYPKYKDVKVYVHIHNSDFDPNNINRVDCLLRVGDGELYGLCSPSGELILPIQYSILDVDDYLTTIVLGKEIERKKENDKEYLYDDDDDNKSIMWDYLMEIGQYSVWNNSITIKKAIVEDNTVQLDYNHFWDGEFKYNEEYDDSRYYSRAESLYDALDGEAGAIWNIDDL